MAARIINGQDYAERIKQGLAGQVAELQSAGRTVHLVAVQVGQNLASQVYTNMQARNCESVGIRYQLLDLPETTGQPELAEEMSRLNRDGRVSGIILQMPLPPHLDAQAAQLAIDPDKDVEGIHPMNLGRLFSGGEGLAPCTAQAAYELLLEACPDLGGKQAVIVGRSDIVGKPIALLLLQRSRPSPTVTICHSHTRDLAQHTRKADIVIVATGASQLTWQRHRAALAAGKKVPPPNLRPLVTADMLGEQAVVIDVATNRIPKGLDAGGQPLKDDQGKAIMITAGDVEFEAASRKVAAITPVPGGVGPVTVAMLLRNTVRCAMG
jgi:methylenetetrahydrofolate dehydrogenase (NADP+)/methenyltetrahydrofolate cyclohydrolase